MNKLFVAGIIGAALVADFAVSFSTGTLVGGNVLGYTSQKLGGANVLPDNIQYQRPSKPVSLQEAKEKGPYFRMPSYLSEGVTVKEVRILEVFGGYLDVIVDLSSENEIGYLYPALAYYEREKSAGVHKHGIQ